MSSLVLGTAQLGMPYGIRNTTGKPSPKTACAIIQEAYHAGIRELDTAQAYGNSEEVLGAALAKLNLVDQVRILSKLDPGINFQNSQVIKVGLEKSLQRLGVSTIQGLMLHREEILEFWTTGLEPALREFVDHGLVQKIGVSVYSPLKALEALALEGIDFVQIPSNILDRRFEEAGVFKSAAKKKKAIYIRSVFLQGLILMKPSQIPVSMAFAKDAVTKVEHVARIFGLSVQALALGYALAKWPQAKIVFGAETVEQVRENLSIRPLEASNVSKIEQMIGQAEERILNPALWPKG